MVSKSEYNIGDAVSFDIKNMGYNMPKQKDMAVCFIYFNASNSKRILMNLLYVQNMMQLAQIPIFTIEVYSTRPSIYKSYRIKSNSILFHKERLCYLLEKKVPAKYTKLLFLDSDLIFDNPKWYDDVSKALDVYDVIQPFKTAYWLDLTYTQIVGKHYSIMVNAKNNHEHLPYNSHPGFGWAFQREWFNRVGYYQYCIVGSGDSLSTMAWFKQSPEMLIRDTNSKYQIPAYKEFVDKMGTTPKISHINGGIYHLFHGSLVKRQYTNRHTIFKDIVDVRTILKEDESGLFEITDREIAQKVKEYFKSRNDDGV